MNNSAAELDVVVSSGPAPSRNHLDGMFRISCLSPHVTHVTRLLTLALLTQ